MQFVNASLRLLGWTVLTAAISAVGWLGYEFGYSQGFYGFKDFNWGTDRFDRDLTLRGAARVLDLSPGPWTQACLFGRGDDWGEAPIPHFGEPPWRFDERYVAVILADASGRTLTLWLPWVQHAPGTPNCVPVDKSTRLIGSEDRPWILRFEQG